MSDERRSGWTFSLTDLFVVTLALTVVVALATPLVRSARDRARSEQCRDNLKELALGLHSFSTTNVQEQYTTGVWDYRSSGCMTEYGWVADLNKIGAAIPGDRLCPSNPLRGTASLRDVYYAKTSDAIGGCDPARLVEGVCGGPEFGAPNSHARAAFIGTRLLSDGLNTNYSPSWFLVSTGTALVGRTDRVVSFRTSVGLGSLTARRAENSLVPMSFVPMIGDGSSGDESSKLPFDASDADGTYRRASLAKDSLLTAVCGKGPAYVEDALIRFLEDEAETRDVDVTVQVAAERVGSFAPPTGPRGNSRYLQDTRHWRAIHGGTLNVAMCDGSVISLTDRNGDGYVNPGFVQPSSAASRRIGYAMGPSECDPFEFYSGTATEPPYGCIALE